MLPFKKSRVFSSEKLQDCTLWRHETALHWAGPPVSSAHMVTESPGTGLLTGDGGSWTQDLWQMLCHWASALPVGICAASKSFCHPSAYAEAPSWCQTTAHGPRIKAATAGVDITAYSSVASPQYLEASNGNVPTTEVLAFFLFANFICACSFIRLSFLPSLLKASFDLWNAPPHQALPKNASLPLHLIESGWSLYISVVGTAKPFKFLLKLRLKEPKSIISRQAASLKGPCVDPMHCTN